MVPMTENDKMLWLNVVIHVSSAAILFPYIYFISIYLFVFLKIIFDFSFKMICFY